MKRFLVTTVACVALSACGHQFADRTLSGAGIGAGAGAVLGPVGVVGGAVIGGVTGAVTPASKVNLGKPIWKK